MTLPVQITFRDLPHSDAAEILIRKQCERILAVAPALTGCTVTVEPAHHHAGRRKEFRVRISLGIPGSDLVVTHDPPNEHAAPEDLYAAIAHAFDVARRRVDEHARRHREAPRRDDPAT